MAAQPPPPSASSAPRHAELRHLLQRANLIEYLPNFLQQGGDDVRQLCESGDEQFKEVIQLVGLASKPLHVRRFAKALQEWRATYGLPDPIGSQHLVLRRNLVDAEVQTEPPTFPEILVSPILAEIAGDIAPHATDTSIPSKCFIGLPVGIDWDEEHKEIIRRYSAIYGRRTKNSKKRKSGELNNHEMAVNSAAAELCMRDPTLLVQRDELFLRARALVRDSGYKYVHGRSRSKMLQSMMMTSSAVTPDDLNCVGQLDIERDVFGGEDLLRKRKVVEEESYYGGKRPRAASSSLDSSDDDDATVFARDGGIEADAAAIAAAVEEVEEEVVIEAGQHGIPVSGLEIDNDIGGSGVVVTRDSIGALHVQTDVDHLP